MSDEGHEARISVLEEWRRGHELWAAEIKQELKDIKKLLGIMSERLASQRLCPAPGECLNLIQKFDLLKNQLEEQEERLRSVEEQRNYWRGMLVAIGAIAGTLTGGVVAWIVAHLKH